MIGPAIRFHHDYVDPASYLVREILVRVGAVEGVEHRPLELRRSSSPLIDPADRDWREYTEMMVARARELGVPFQAPALVPWSAKAHELALHAAEVDPGLDVHASIYTAYFAQGRDIGRVDVLIEIADEAGLDPIEAKAVLDVDRFSHRLAELRSAALAAGIRGVPTLSFGTPAVNGELLEGFHTEEEIGTFLKRAAGRS